MLGRGNYSGGLFLVRNESVSKPFVASVRVWRSRLGISQEELAERAQLHRTYISDVERGARNVSLTSIDRLARALEVPISTLVADPSGPSAPSPLLPADRLVDILFVEDQADDVELAMHALRNANITNRIHSVSDCAEALDFLFATGKYAHRQQNDHPQLILLDLNLPKIDGLEVLRQIKADPRMRKIPVIVLTASSRSRDIAASKQLGADGYIVKPVDFKNLSAITPQLGMRWALLKSAPAPRA